MRKIFVYRDGRLVEKDEAGPYKGLTIIPDTPGCVDPIERKWLEGRAARREYMKRHDVYEIDPGHFKTEYTNPRIRRRFGLKD